MLIPFSQFYPNLSFTLHVMGNKLEMSTLVQILRIPKPVVVCADQREAGSQVSTGLSGSDWWAGEPGPGARGPGPPHWLSSLSVFRTWNYSHLQCVCVCDSVN